MAGTSSFIDDMENPKHWYATIFLEACKEGTMKVVESLISHPSVDPSSSCNSPLTIATCAGKVKVVKALLADSRVDPRECAENLMIDAAKVGYTDVVEVLLEDGRVDPAAVDNHALRLASQRGHAAVVALLLTDPRVSPSDGIALKFAAIGGHADVVAILLEDPRTNPKQAADAMFLRPYEPLTEGVAIKTNARNRRQSIEDYTSILVMFVSNKKCMKGI